MRTKTLLLTAALSAAGIATSMAQVYSVNAVGYVNTTLVPGFNLVSNPLDNKTGNTIANLFGTGIAGGPPDGLIVYYFNATTDSYVTALYDGLLQAWSPAAAGNQAVVPGEGVFVFNPNAGNVTATFVGEVPQGSLANPLPQGFSIKASQVPQAGTITALGYGDDAVDGDIIYKWNSATDVYSSHVYDGLLTAWTPTEPIIAVGEAFFLFKAAAGTWDRDFNVNQ